MVMKAFTVAILASSALVVSLAGFCQTGAKKEKDTKAEATTKTKTPPGSGPKQMSATLIIKRGGPPQAFGAHLEPILTTVSASKEQRKEITAIVEDFKAKIVPLRNRHDELREEFFKTLTSGQSGETVLATQSEFIRAQNDLSTQYLALRLKIQQVLTPEQNQKFAEYRQNQGWKSK